MEKSDHLKTIFNELIKDTNGSVDDSVLCPTTLIRELNKANAPFTSQDVAAMISYAKHGGEEALIQVGPCATWKTKPENSSDVLWLPTITGLGERPYNSSINFTEFEKIVGELDINFDDSGRVIRHYRGRKRA